jgi:nucleoside-diphosphate-sugar epimerase
MGELNCELFARLYGLPTIRLRYFMTYGPRQPSTGPYAVVTGVFLGQWENRQPLTIFGDGSQTRDFIHVKDVAEANVVAFESDLRDATINVGTGKSLTIKELADLISPERVWLPKRVPDIDQQCACTARMRRLLQWEAKYDLPAYLQETILRKIAENPGKYPRPLWLKH